VAPAPPKAALGFPRPCLVAAVLPADSRRKAVPERPRSESLSWFSSLGEFEGSNMFKADMASMGYINQLITGGTTLWFTW
jgi:hypothetical protein